MAAAHVPALMRQLGSRYPIVLAPMMGSSGPALQAAVANAGGFAFFPGGKLPAASLRAGLQAARQRLGPAAAPLGVNIWAPTMVRDADSWTQGEAEAVAEAAHRQEALIEELQEPAAIRAFKASLGAVQTEAECEAVLQGQVDVLLEEGVLIVSVHFGWLQPAHVRRLHDAGVTLIGNATSVAEALELEERGADAIIAQGKEAGGHQGAFLDLSSFRERTLTSTVQLVREVTAAVAVPVIAAGGIMDGADIQAALSAGAQAVQMGTAFLTAEESLARPEHRQALLGAHGTTVLTQAFTGKPARALANQWTERMGDVERRLPNTFSGLPGGRPLSEAAAKVGRTDAMMMWAGEGFARCRALPAAQLLARVAEEAGLHEAAGAKERARI